MVSKRDAKELLPQKKLGKLLLGKQSVLEHIQHTVTHLLSNIVVRTGSNANDESTGKVW